ncbi:hypothetical protein JY469_21715 [Serratia marcescens]|nr:hypothetical protein [Serratia marcescens]
MIDKYLLEDLSLRSDEKGELARWVIQLQADVDTERRKSASLESVIYARDTRIAELEAKLATPVRLTEERTLWAGEDDYDTGHVKGWNANRIEQAALLKNQGFTVAEDA